MLKVNVRFDAGEWIVVCVEYAGKNECSYISSIVLLICETLSTSIDKTCSPVLHYRRNNVKLILWPPYGPLIIPYDMLKRDVTPPHQSIICR